MKRSRAAACAAAAILASCAWMTVAFIPFLPATSTGGLAGVVRPSITLPDLWIRDPSIIHVNGLYHMTGTTGGDGFTCHTSPDLVTWTTHAGIYARNASNPWAQQDFWAAEMVERDGTFYLFFSARTATTPRRTGVAWASDPLGPYVDLGPDALTPPAWDCIDGHLFVDTCGTPYLFYSRIMPDEGAGWELYVQEINDTLTGLTGDPVLVVRGQDPRWSNWYVAEGASVLLVNDTYYCFFSGYSWSNYTVGYASAPAIRGPWTIWERPIITHNAGHCNWFRINGTGALMLSFHDDNFNGNERAVIAPLTWREPGWGADGYWMHGYWDTAYAFLAWDWDFLLSWGEIGQAAAAILVPAAAGIAVAIAWKRWRGRRARG